MIALCEFDEKLRRAKFEQPESDLRFIGTFLIFKIVGLEQSPDHGPVFIALRFLGPHQIGKRKQVALAAIGKFAVVRRRQSFGKGSTPLIFDMTSTRIRNASGC
jgi:hypothetical protein